MSSALSYRSQSGKKALLNAFLLKHVAKHVSLVASMSRSIEMASSPSASHLVMILS
eukprot:CAMPEP_0178624196 /NCGR_PEP_ID=MMETSP0698-20121128/7227_1 /TAXON_ID=265572 /ORGANISM="Extubocellulus spinifer, Strain CCMP396" /LENGTH=55 /DNA_ID=CAMNT_0020263299 /DNA_START=127 /DNA_END=291 /DNA_ORIENTATION=-